jgi:hypothetical protein
LDAIRTYRPPEDEVFQWHTVTSGIQENFNTIAARHRVPVERIIGFNFPGTVENGRVLTEVVNWYLRHHKGFGGPETRDRRNRMFRGGERVAIPYVSRVDAGEPLIFMGRKKPLTLDEPGHILASQKFVHEFKIPPNAPAEVGYIAYQVRISIEGEVIQPNGVLKTQFKKDQVKGQIESQLDGDLKAVFSAKYDEKVLKAAAEEVAKGSKTGFVKVLMAPLEASLKENFKFGKISIVPEVGVEGLEIIKEPGKLPTPIVFRVAGEWQDTLLIEGTRLQGKFTFKAGFNLGLSKKGWAWIAQKVGGEALKRFLAASGRAMAQAAAYLVAEGILAAGAAAVAAVATAVTVTAVVAWLAVDAERNGKMRGMAGWYYTAYVNKVFGLERPSGPVSYEFGQVRDDLVRLGEKDALDMALGLVQKKNAQATHPTEADALRLYREMAVQFYGSEANAKQQLTNALRTQIETKLGVY